MNALQPRLDGVTPRWRLRDIGLVALLIVALQLGGLVVLSVLGLPRFAPTVPTSLGHVARQLVGSAATIAAVVLVARRRGDVRQLVPLHVPSAKWIRPTVAIALLLLLAKAAIAGAVAQGPRVPVALLLGSILSVGVATAVEEELLYRGVLYGWLSGVVRPSAAAMLSAGVFAIEHAGLQTGSVTSAFLFGLLFAGLYQRSGSLLPGIVIHAASNVGSLLFLLYVK